jgi:hypothetical protein
MQYHYIIVRNDKPFEIVHTSIGRIPYETKDAALAMGDVLIRGSFGHPDTHHVIAQPVEEVQVTALFGKPMADLNNQPESVLTVTT